MVDFTTPEAAPANVMEAINAGVHAVVGSTGFDLEELRERSECRAARANCFVAPNFAIGAVLMMEAVEADCAAHARGGDHRAPPRPEEGRALPGTAKRTAELIREAGGNVHEPIHSVRLPGPGRAPGGGLRRRRGRRSRSATTPPTAPASCPACCWRSARSPSCRSASSSAWRICSERYSQAEMAEIGGVITAMVTPFTEDRSVDEAAARKLARHLIEQRLARSRAVGHHRGVADARRRGEALAAASRPRRARTGRAADLRHRLERHAALRAAFGGGGRRRARTPCSP